MWGGIIAVEGRSVGDRRGEERAVRIRNALPTSTRIEIYRLVLSLTWLGVENEVLVIRILQRGGGEPTVRRLK